MGSATLRVDYLAWVCPCSRWESVGFIQPPTLKENRVESTRGHKSEGVALRSLCGGGNAQGTLWRGEIQQIPHGNLSVPGPWAWV